MGFFGNNLLKLFCRNSVSLVMATAVFILIMGSNILAQDDHALKKPADDSQYKSKASGVFDNYAPLGFDRYPKREYSFLFNELVYNILYTNQTVTKFVTIPAGTIPCAKTFESGYSAIIRLTNFPINLLYGKIGVGWTSLIMAMKVVLVDFPLSYTIKVFNHEFSGHTVRMHEAGGYITKITIGVPLPYGRGGGATNGTASTSVDQHLLVTAAGSEANSVMAHEMSLQWVSVGAVFPFDIVMYQNAKFDQLLYINRSTSHSRGFYFLVKGDYEDYILSINNKYGRIFPHNYRLKLDMLKRWSYIALADPFLLQAANAFFYNIFSGKLSMKNNMLPVGKVEIMPSTRVAYTPNGPECYGDIFIKLRKNMVILTYVRVGAIVFRRFGGAGFRVYRAGIGRYVELGGGADLSSQPGLTGFISPLYQSRFFPQYIPTLSVVSWYRAYHLPQRFCAAAYADLTIKPNDFFRFHGRIGYKTDGYVFGMQLRKGLFWHAGIGIYF